LTSKQHLEAIDYRSRLDVTPRLGGEPVATPPQRELTELEARISSLVRPTPRSLLSGLELGETSGVLGGLMHADGFPGFDVSDIADAMKNLEALEVAKASALASDIDELPPLRWRLRAEAIEQAQVRRLRVENYDNIAAEAGVVRVARRGIGKEFGAKVAEAATSRPTLVPVADAIEEYLRPLERSPVGRISLSASKPELGSRMKVTAELVEVEPGDGVGEIRVSRNIEAVSQEFRVDRLGLYGDISPTIHFISRDGAVDDPAFTIAGSASYLLHYRATNTRTWQSRMWNEVNPGIGLTASALTFDGEAELGLGCTFTLFDDLLQGGVGYSMTGSRDNEYFYVGVGIIELLDQTGLIRAVAGGD
jgi:hypothetical protein